jgi:hypothetical protein
MSALVCDSLELAAQMQLLQERLLRSLKIDQNSIASRARARTSAPPSRGMGAVLTFPAQKHGFPPERMVDGADVHGTTDRTGRARDLQHSAVHAGLVDSTERSQLERTARFDAIQRLNTR